MLIIFMILWILMINRGHILGSVSIYLPNEVLLMDTTSHKAL